MHWDMIQFLLPAFTASLVIAGIHAYLGVHVVERGVIFVDLSLAQIAAFGATLSILMPWSDGDPHSSSVYWISLLFTFFLPETVGRTFAVIEAKERPAAS